MTQLKYLTLLLCFSLLGLNISGCSFPGVYKLTIQQGNIVTQDMVDKLKPGMNKKQVAYIMGTPLAKSPFLQEKNNDQWDYLYTLEKRDKIVKRYHVSLFFKNDIYSHHTGKAAAAEVLKEMKEENKEKPLKEQKINLQQAPTGSQ